MKNPRLSIVIAATKLIPAVAGLEEVIANHAHLN